MYRFPVVATHVESEYETGRTLDGLDLEWRRRKIAESTRLVSSLHWASQTKQTSFKMGPGRPLFVNGAIASIQ
jgi:hypothetical protein